MINYAEYYRLKKALQSDYGIRLVSAHIFITNSKRSSEQCRRTTAKLKFQTKNKK